MGNRSAALHTEVALVEVVPAARRTLDWIFELGFFVTPLAPRAACPTIRHINIPLRIQTSANRKPLCLRRLRSTRRARSLGSTVEALRLQRNLLGSRRRGCISASCFLGCSQIGTALHAGVIRGLVESAALEALNHRNGVCWSVAHSISLDPFIDRGMAGAPKVRGRGASHKGGGDVYCSGT